MLYIIIILWGAMAFLLLMQNAEACAGLGLTDRIIVSLILLTGAPILIIASVLQSILSIILPEGWDNDDDDFKKH